MHSEIPWGQEKNPLTGGEVIVFGLHRGLGIVPASVSHTEKHHSLQGPGWSTQKGPASAVEEGSEHCSGLTLQS